MHFSTGRSDHSWEPAMTTDTTDPYYWLNWRFFLSAIWVLSSMIIASILIWRYEGPDGDSRETAEARREKGTLYRDESWRPCLKVIHPAWLLAFRIIAFFILLALLLVNAIVDGGGIFYYYTQWAFLLVTIYFGVCPTLKIFTFSFFMCAIRLRAYRSSLTLGSLLSMYGCHKYLSEVSGNVADHVSMDAERGTYVAQRNEENANSHSIMKNTCSNQGHYVREAAGLWGYVFQIVYQTNAGAVMLTDFVFWLIIFPFLALKDYDLNLLLVGMHSVNAVFLLGDTALNSLRFPWFRIAYFLLWTSIYVIFQWIVHACVSIWWPYPFLDLSSPHAPIWYLLVAVLHVPCYAIFPLIIKMKHALFSRWFPRSYQCMK